MSKSGRRKAVKHKVMLKLSCEVTLIRGDEGCVNQDCECCLLFSETANFFLQSFILSLRVVVIVTTVMGMCVMRIRGGG